MIKGWGLGVNEVEVCLDLLAIEPVEVILLAGRYTLLDRRAEAALLPCLRDCGGSLVVGSSVPKPKPLRPVAATTLRTPPAKPPAIPPLSSPKSLTGAE